MSMLVYAPFGIVPREILATEVKLNLPTEKVIQVLEQIAAWRSYPAKLRMSNDPEFIAVTLAN